MEIKKLIALRTLVLALIIINLFLIILINFPAPLSPITGVVR